MISFEEYCAQPDLHPMGTPSTNLSLLGVSYCHFLIRAVDQQILEFVELGLAIPQSFTTYKRQIKALLAADTFIDIAWPEYPEGVVVGENLLTLAEEIEAQSILLSLLLDQEVPNDAT